MKKKNLVLWLVLGALCLQGCSFGTGGEDKTKTVEETDTEEKATRKEKDEDEDEDETEGEETQEETEAAAPEEPSLLSVMSAVEYDNVWEDGRSFYRSNYLKVWMDDRDEADPDTGALAFPQLAQALAEVNAQTGESEDKAKAELETAAREMAAYGTYQELTWEEKTWVIRADSQVLSLLKENCEFAGGPHPNYEFTGITIDSKSGRQMKLEDIVADPQSMVKLVADRLAEEYPDVMFYDNFREIMEKELEEGYLTWIVGYEGITFYFDPYELASYAEGTQIITILYEEEPDQFDEEIRRVPSMWASQLAPGMEFDLGHDGIADRVEVIGIRDAYDNAYEELRIRVNGREVSIDTWIYSYNSYVVGGEDLETELLVTETSSDNDYRVINICRLDPEKAGFGESWQFSGTGLASYSEELEDGTYKYGNMLLTDPKHFCLETWFGLLSTYYGSQWCGISEEAGDDGYLVMEHPWFDVDRGDSYLTLLVPLEMETGETRASQVYPAGTKLWIIRIEGANCVVFRTEDENICRVYVDSSQWPGTIEGVEGMTIDDIFDGMMFAG